jgi:hypothetical protein
MPHGITHGVVFRIAYVSDSTLTELGRELSDRGSRPERNGSGAIRLIISNREVGFKAGQAVQKCGF